MKKRLVVWLGIVIVVLLAVAWLVPTSRYLLIGLVNNEPLESGRPISYWIDELKNRNATSREDAARTLGGMGPRAKAAVPALLEVVADEDGRVRRATIESLGRIGPDAQEAIPALIKCYQDRNEKEDIRRAAVAALGEIGPAAKDAVPVMIKTLAQDEAFALSGHIQMAVMRMGPAAVPGLIQLLQHDDPEVRAHAAVALNWIGPGARDAVPALIRALDDDGNSVRQGAAFALLRIGPAAKDAVPALIKALKDEDPEVRRVVALALKEIDPGAAAAEGVK